MDVALKAVQRLLHAGHSVAGHCEVVVSDGTLQKRCQVAVAVPQPLSTSGWATCTVNQRLGHSHWQPAAGPQPLSTSGWATVTVIQWLGRSHCQPVALPASSVDSSLWMDHWSLRERSHLSSCSAERPLVGCSRLHDRYIYRCPPYPVATKGRVVVTGKRRRRKWKALF